MRRGSASITVAVVVAVLAVVGLVPCRASILSNMFSKRSMGLHGPTVAKAGVAADCTINKLPESAKLVWTATSATPPTVTGADGDYKVTFAVAEPGVPKTVTLSVSVNGAPLDPLTISLVAPMRTLMIDQGANLGDNAVVTIADGTPMSPGLLDWVILEAQSTSAPLVTHKKIKGVAQSLIMPTFDDSVHVDGGLAVHGVVKTVAPEELVYKTGTATGNEQNAEACQGHYEGAADDFMITAAADPMCGKRLFTLYEGAWNGILTVTAKVGAGEPQTFTVAADQPQNRAYKFTFSSEVPGEMLEVHTSVPANDPAHFLYGAALCPAPATAPAPAPAKPAPVAPAPVAPIAATPA